MKRWTVFHARPAQTARGEWRTPVAGDGAGFPDLVLVRSGQAIFAELKAETGKLRPEQLAWAQVLEELELAAGGAVLYRVWRPSSWPEIEELLTAPRRPAR